MAGMEIFSGLIALSVLAAGIIHCISPEKSSLKFVRLGPDWAIWAFWGVIASGAFLISTLPAGMSWEVIGEARWILSLYALAAAVTYVRPDQEKIFLWLAGCAILVSLYTFVQVFTGIDLFRGKTYVPDNYAGVEIWRAKGFFSNTMAYSYSIGTLLSFLYAALLCSAVKGRGKWLIMAAAILLTVSLFVTFTRGAWIAGFIALVAQLFLWNRKRGLQIVVMIITVIAIAAVISQPVRERLASIYQEKEGSHSVSQRLELWQANWAMFKDHPWLGVGYGQNSLYVQEYHNKLLGRDGFVSNAHSNYLQVLAGIGVFGFFLWIYFCAAFFMKAVRLWTRASRSDLRKAPRQRTAAQDWAEAIALGSIGAQIFFHVGGLTQATFFDNEPLYMFLFGWALLISQKENECFL